MRAADAAEYFLKVRTGAVNEPGLLVPCFLRDQGIAGVVAPLPTCSSALWALVADYALILYPFIEGRTGMETGLSDRQWVEFGTSLRQVHESVLPQALARSLRREYYTPVGAASIARLDAQIDAHAFADPEARELAAFWLARRTEIRALSQMSQELGQRLARAAPAFVLCHADIHTANVLLDSDQHVRIVDWDETLLAPRERDLMFVVGGIIGGLVTPRSEGLFFQGYGATAIDPLALAYYRYAWAVADIGAYGEEVISRPDLGTVSRRAALGHFKSLFAPGNIVALARATDASASWPVTGEPTRQRAAWSAITPDVGRP